MSELHTQFSIKAKQKGLSFTIKTTLPENKAHIKSDKSILNRILINLLTNALKFTSQGFIKLGYEINEKKLILYVKDSGVGISKDNIKHIFDRFVQEEKILSRKNGGLGLGLSISKENANLLGGDLTVESKKKSRIYLHTLHTIHTR